MTSYAKKLEHEVTYYADKCDLKIPDGRMYIISFHLPSDVRDNSREIAQKMLYHNPEHVPLFVYCSEPRIYACYDGCKAEDIYLKGSIQALISKYSSCATKWSETDDYVSVRVIYFETQSQIYAYLIWEMYVLIRMRIQEASSKITDAEKTNLSITELVGKLKTDDSVDWNAETDAVKYGVFYRFKTVKGDKVIVTFSRRLDFNNYASDFKVIFS